jgi:hypothetical protein
VVCELKDRSQLELEPGLLSPPRGKTRRRSLRFLEEAVTFAWCIHWLFGWPAEDTQIRISRIKRRTSMLLDRLQNARVSWPSYFNVPPPSHFGTGRQRLLCLTGIPTKTTGRDEDRPGRLLLGRFRESGLSVA